MKEFKYYFKLRFAEWVSGVCILIWGLLALINEPIFSIIPVFMSMAETLPYYVWGGLATLAGTIKIIFLIINGSWRRSTHLRVFGSMISVFCWGAILINFITIDYISPNIALAFALVSADIFSLWYASAEAKEADLVYRNET
jgi:hypothetical protein